MTPRIKINKENNILICEMDRTVNGNNGNATADKVY